MAFCSNCGTPVGEGVKFCPSCGTPVAAPAAQPEAPAAPAQQAYQAPQQAPAQQPYQAPQQAPAQQPYQQPYQQAPQQAPAQQPYQQAPQQAPAQQPYQQAPQQPYQQQAPQQPYQQQAPQQAYNQGYQPEYNYQSPGFQYQQTRSDAEQNKLMGVLSYLGILVLVPIFAAKESRFARFHANQGLILFICEIAWFILFMIIGAILIHLVTWRSLWILQAASFFEWIGSIFFLVLAIIGIVNACKGEEKELPIIGKYQILK